MYTLGAAIDAAVYRGFWQNAYRGTAVFGEKYRGLIGSMEGQGGGCNHCYASAVYCAVIGGEVI